MGFHSPASLNAARAPVAAVGVLFTLGAVGLYIQGQPMAPALIVVGLLGLAALSANDPGYASPEPDAIADIPPCSINSVESLRDSASTCHSCLSALQRLAYYQGPCSTSSRETIERCRHALRAFPSYAASFTAPCGQSSALTVSVDTAFDLSFALLQRLEPLLMQDRVSSIIAGRISQEISLCLDIIAAHFEKISATAK